MRLSAKKAASFLPASAALQEIREAIGLFVVFFRKTTPRDLYQTTVIAKLL